MLRFLGPMTFGGLSISHELYIGQTPKSVPFIGPQDQLFAWPNTPLFPCPRMGLLKENSSLPWAREDGTFKGPPGIAKPTTGSMTEGMGGMMATQKPGALCTSSLSRQGPIYLL